MGANPGPRLVLMSRPAQAGLQGIHSIADQNRHLLQERVGSWDKLDFTSRARLMAGCHHGAGIRRQPRPDSPGLHHAAEHSLDWHNRCTTTAVAVTSTTNGGTKFRDS